MHRTPRTPGAPALAALWLLIAVLVGLRPALAGTGQPVIEQYALPNGLTVILAPMPAAQRVSIVTGYQTGSADEPKGRSGFAHLFEHLMFEGTRAVPDFDAATASLGAETNAYTQWDSTTYYMVGPANNLPGLLRLEADRMANLANAVTQEDLDNQRDIVRNEMRQNTLDQPGAAARLQSLATLAGPRHPYGHATIGSLADLEAATLSDVQAFHRTYYVPSNAIVAITGKFDVAVARDLVARTLGLVPPGERPAPAEGELSLSGPQRLQFTDAVQTPQVMMMWNGPREETREDLTALMVSIVLSSDSGPLYAKLVHRDGLASAVACSWESRRLGGSFSIIAQAASGIDAARLEAGLLSALREIDAEGVTRDQLQAGAASVLSYFDSAVADPLSYGLILQGTAATAGDARAWRKDVEDAASIAPEEAMALLRRITAGPAVAAVVIPGARNDQLPQIVALSTGAAEPLSSSARDDVSIPDLPELTSDAIAFPSPMSFTLANGLAVNVYRSGDTSTTAMALVLPLGTTVANGERKGLVELAIDLTARGAGTMSSADFSLAADTAGARIGAAAFDHATMFTLAAPTRSFAKAAELFALAITKPRFDIREWQTQVEQRAQSLERRLRDPSAVANRAVAAAAFPLGAAEGEVMDARQIRSLAMADAAQLFDALLQPATARLEIVSALPPDEVRGVIEPLLGAWTKDNSAVLKAPAPVAPRFAPQEIVEHVAGASQAAILLGFSAPQPFTPAAIANDVAMQVLGGGSSGRLYRRLREEKGWSYGIYGGTSDGEKYGGNAMGYIETSVQADRMRESLAEIRRVLGDVAQAPISPAEFDAALQEIRTQYAATLETSDGLSRAIAWSVASGFELADAARKLALYEKVTLAEVRVQAEAMGKRDMITVIAGNSAKMK